MTVARRLAALAVITLVAGSACSSGASDESEMLPDVDLVGVGETTVSSGSWVGEPLVINFWFSTCIPCEKELVDFAEVDATRDDVRFIGVNPIDTPEAMVDFAAERGVEYDLFRDELAELQEALGVAQFPATYFVATDGTIISATGVLDADSLNDEIDDLLANDADVTETLT